MPNTTGPSAPAVKPTQTESTVTDAGLKAAMYDTFMEESTPPTDPEADPESEPEANPDPEADPEPEANPDPETDPEPEADPDIEADPDEMDGASPELKDRIQKRIDKEVAKRKSAETRAEQSEARISELETQVQELSAQAEGKPVIPPSQHELMLTDDPKRIDEYDGYLSDAMQWALKHWDGYEGEDENGQDIVYTGEQVRLRYAQLQTERQRLIPAARQAFSTRHAQEAVAKEVYPNLFNRQHSDFVTMQQALQQVPELKRLPNFRLIIGDMLAGERARSESSAPKPKPTPKPPPPPPKPGSATPSVATLSNKKALQRGQAAARAMTLEGISDADAVALMDSLSE